MSLKKNTRKVRRNINLSKTNKKNKSRKIIQIIVNIVMIIYMVAFFIIMFFFANFYTVGIWTFTGFIFVVIAVIVCPECRSGKSLKKSSKMGTTDMPDKAINSTE